MMKLTDSEGEALVKIARKAVEAYLDRGKTIEAEGEQSKALRVKGRVFVTILSRVVDCGSETHQLRGCIGYLQARLRLLNATINSAISAATADPRFPPMTSNELDNCLFEVNVLTQPVKLSSEHPSVYPKMIRIGVDGLMISKGMNRGLLLPGVPVEWGWTSEEFLIQCSMKAGLQPDAWLDPDSKVFKFQSVIFREIEPSGRVKRVTMYTSI